MNPLIEKYEEVYGKKPVEDGMVEQIAALDNHNVISLGDNTVIPTAQVTSTGINLTGDYITPSAFISNGSIIGNNTLTTYTRTVQVPHQTAVEHQFFKVLEDVGKGRATVSEIRAEIDPTFTGFGGQIKYTVEIIGTYP